MYGPAYYAVEAETIARYAEVVGESDPIHRDADAARAAGFADVVAPPMFAVVYCARSMEQVFNDPALALDLPRLLHTAQAFEWGEPVVAGDLIATNARVAADRLHGAQRLCTFVTESRNQHGDVVLRGRCTVLIRG
jgi:acyl dehydratase